VVALACCEPDGDTPQPRTVATTRRYDPDLVVSVHPLMQHIPARVLGSRAKRLGRVAPVPLATVVTDFTTCHNTWFYEKVNKCFVPTEFCRYVHQLPVVGMQQEQFQKDCCVQCKPWLPALQWPWQPQPCSAARCVRRLSDIPIQLCVILFAISTSLLRHRPHSVLLGVQAAWPWYGPVA
jgi:hypothetical protein